MSGFDSSTATAGALWLSLIVVAITASCLTAMTVYGVRRGQRTGELFGELVLISIFIPTALMYAASHLPPELFGFLK